MIKSLRSRLNTKYATIDHEHERVFQLLENLTSEELDKRRVKITEELCLYVAEHFSHEEALMIEYPEVSKHKLEHTKIQEEVIAIIRPFLQGTLTGDEAITAISNPIIHHMINHDVPFAEWLRTH